MKEKSLRTAHRTVALPLVLFIILQGATGTVISFEDLLGQDWGGLPELIHFHLGTFGNIYRVLLGIGILWMAFTGFWIYMKIQERSKKAAQT